MSMGFISVLVFLVYFALCLVVAYYNYQRGNRFGTGFILSLVLTPVIGLIIARITKDKKREIKMRKGGKKGHRRKKKYYM